jgi:hypothetical protein
LGKKEQAGFGRDLRGTHNSVLGAELRLRLVVGIRAELVLQKQMERVRQLCLEVASEKDESRVSDLIDELQIAIERFQADQDTSGDGAG